MHNSPRLIYSKGTQADNERGSKGWSGREFDLEAGIRRAPRQRSVVAEHGRGGFVEYPNSGQHDGFRRWRAEDDGVERVTLRRVSDREPFARCSFAQFCGARAVDRLTVRAQPPAEAEDALRLH